MTGHSGTNSARRQGGNMYRIEVVGSKSGQEFYSSATYRNKDIEFIVKATSGHEIIARTKEGKIVGCWRRINIHGKEKWFRIYVMKGQDSED